MISTKLKFYLYLFFYLSSISSILSFAPTVFYKPYDVNFTTEKYLIGDDKYAHIKSGLEVEYGDTIHSINLSGETPNVLKIYNHAESTIAMLKGAPVGSDAYNLGLSLNTALSPETDDGRRGRISFHGKFKEINYNLFVGYLFSFYRIPGYFSLIAYLPIVDKQISNVTSHDLTNDVLAEDILVKENLTDNFNELIYRIGHGLKFDNFHKVGPGDFTLMLAWQHDFIQQKNYLKKVRLTGRFGFSAPTSAKRNENLAYSMPLGFDGAWGLPITVGLDVFFKKTITAGVEFELLQLSDKTRVRRLKTDRSQTELLLLNKGLCRKRFGDTWKFNLYVESFQFLGGLTARAAYQFVRHDDDRLYSKSYEFSDAIINSAKMLKDWTFQTVIFQLNYDFYRSLSRHSYIRPQLMVFAKLPIRAGHAVIAPNTFGGQFVLNF